MKTVSLNKRLEASRAAIAEGRGVVADAAYFHRLRDTAFLKLLSDDIAGGNLKADLPADVAAYARTRDLSQVDVDEVFEGDVEL